MHYQWHASKCMSLKVRIGDPIYTCTRLPTHLQLTLSRLVDDQCLHSFHHKFWQKKYVVEPFLGMKSSILTFVRLGLVLNILFFFLFVLYLWTVAFVSQSISYDNFLVRFFFFLVICFFLYTFGVLRSTLYF
jgi:hypothetical protein